jgi:hypothetical protein
LVIELGLTDYSARRAAASIACLQGFIVSAFSKVIRALRSAVQQLEN